MDKTIDDFVNSLDPAAMPGSADKPEPYDYQRDFWLAQPFFSSSFASEVVERFATHVEAWGGSQSNVSAATWAAYRAYHGIDGQSYSGTGLDPIVSITEAGEAGEFLSMRMNQYRGLVKHQIALVTANRPDWDPVARTTDSKANSQKQLTAQILDFEMDSKGKGRALKTQYEIAKTCAAGFLAQGWNEHFGLDGRGEVWALPLTPWEVAHERVRVYDQCNWWIFRAYESRWDWVAKFAKEDPEKAEKIRGLSSEQNVANAFMYNDPAVREDSDRIEVLYVYARPTRACPKGRVAIVAGSDLVLLDGPNPYGDTCPIRRLCPAEFVGTSVPFGDSWVLLAPDEAFNACMSMALTRIDAFGVPDIAVPAGSDYKQSDFSGRNMIEITPGGGDPHLMDFLKIPPELGNMMDRFKGGMEDLSGINSVTRGNPQENVTSGSYAALLQSMAVQFNSADEDAWIRNLEGVGSDIVRIYQSCATDKQLVNICGSDQAWTAKEFTSESLDQIQRVSIKVGNAMSKTVAGRMAIADNLLQRNLIQTPQEYLQALATGNVTPLFSGPAQQLNIIKAENERIMKGEAPLVSVLDDDRLHISEHRCLMDTSARDDLPLAKAIQAHVDAHMDSWREKTMKNPDLLEALGQPPLSMAAQVRDQTNAQTGGAPGPQVQPGPRQQQQPGTEPAKAKPGPERAPPGKEAGAMPEQPAPAKTPAGQAVV